MADRNGIPEEQWAARIHEDGHWEIEKCKVPVPGPGQVLIKVECAPINPSDIYFLQGNYANIGEGVGGKIQYPLTPGWEGSGTVVSSGGGFMAWRIVGTRVAMSKCEEPNQNMTIGGCYQQYMVTSAL